MNAYITFYVPAAFWVFVVGIYAAGAIMGWMLTRYVGENTNGR